MLVIHCSIYLQCCCWHKDNHDLFSFADPIYTAVDDEGPEPDPPEPFEYIED